ncbi:MAG: DPP IV N-terminal domain-containing protein [Bacteroidales bacterium]|nr:DPP IV N-terminal domain-containing protein [Bacteroidales bacterium]
MTRKIHAVNACILLIFITIQASAQKHLTIEDCVTGAVSHLAPDDLEQPAWRPSSREYTFVEDDQLMASSANGRQHAALTGLAALNNLLASKGINAFNGFPSYRWISNKEILFANDAVIVWYDVDNQSVYRYIICDDDIGNLDFSPGYSHVAFTLANNLYLFDADGNRHVASSSTDKAIVSGQAVHRNEFGISKGTFWNPQGTALAYYVKDESSVTDYPLVDATERVSTLRNIKYPMAGMSSEKVQVGIYRPADRSTVFLDTGEPDDHYLTNIAWSNDGKFICLAEINRDQNHLRLNRYNAQTGAFVATLFEERDPKYLDPLNPVVFLPDNSGRFLWQSRRDGYNHFYLYGSEGKELKQITAGEWEVLNFVGFSHSGDAVYFTATKDGAKNEMLYRVNLNNGRINTVTTDPGVHSVILNQSEDLILDRFSSLTVPNTVQIREGDSRLVRTLLEAQNPLGDYILSEVEDGRLLAADGRTELHYRLFKPQNRTEGKKYPVIVYVYNGPLVQLIKNSQVNPTELWLHYMADQGFVGFILDGRGSANRGRDFEQVTFRSLGTHEMEDQLKGVEFLKSLDYVDPGRIGVFGWSYGGFMTTSLMTTFPDVFSAGVAGGPVTDWKYYEVMYGERYMDTPEDNPGGYTETSVLNKVQNLKGDLLVIHGAMDPVVVWQHSLMLIRKCVEEDVLIDYFVYPTHEHNITGTDRVHLMRMVTDFFIKNL